MQREDHQTTTYPYRSSRSSAQIGTAYILVSTELISKGARKEDAHDFFVCNLIND